MSAPPSDIPAFALSDYITILNRRKLAMFVTALLVLTIPVALAIWLPPVFRSAATILIEQQEIPQELVRSTVTTFADQRLQVIRQRVMTTSNLIEILNKYDLYRDQRATSPIEQVIEKMASDIEMATVSADVVDPRTGKPAQATIAFKIAYSSHSADLAQRVANELTSLYLNENLKTRTTMTAETSEFLTEEAGKLETRIRELESELATFKEGNAESLPELVQLNLQIIDRTERELFEVERELRAIEERKIYLSAELAQLEPTVPAPVRPSLITDRGDRVLESKDRLKLLRSQYLTAQARYSPTHPDLVRLKREIQAIEAEVDDGSSVVMLEDRVSALRGKLAAAKQRYSTSHPDVRRLTRQLKATQAELDAAIAAAGPRSRITSVRDGERENPAYVQIRAQIEAAVTDQRSLKQKMVELRRKVASYERRLALTPQVERTYRDLSRNYENAVTKYQEIRAKQMEAQLAESLESEQKGERFTLIEPPLLPEKPDSPNRLAIVLLGLVLSVTGGLGMAALIEVLDDTVRGRRGMISVIGHAPLATIPHIGTRNEDTKQFKLKCLIAVIVLAVLAGAAAAVHFFFLPLDVLWFASLRRLGL